MCRHITKLKVGSGITSCTFSISSSRHESQSETFPLFTTMRNLILRVGQKSAIWFYYRCGGGSVMRDITPIFFLRAAYTSSSFFLLESYYAPSAMPLHRRRWLSGEGKVGSLNVTTFKTLAASSLFCARWEKGLREMNPCSLSCCPIIVACTWLSPALVRRRLDTQCVRDTKCVFAPWDTFLD